MQTHRSSPFGQSLADAYSISLDLMMAPWRAYARAADILIAATNPPKPHGMAYAQAVETLDPLPDGITSTILLRERAR